MLSYNKEQAAGDDAHNIITIAMRQYSLDVQEAIYWASKFHDKLKQRFHDAYTRVPRFGGPVDLDIQMYVDGVARWVRANHQWSFEIERYFGTKGSEVLRTWQVELSPKKET